MANIFFDLDGTLINSQHRLYNLFIELCPKCRLTYDEYWRIKREGITQQELLCQYYNYNRADCSRFKNLWLAKIEEPFRLAQDFLVDGIKDALCAAKSKHSLYVITNRQSKKLAVDEVRDLGIIDYFENILVTEQKTSKVDLMKKAVSISPTDVLVGDAVEDISYARRLGIVSCVVSWGISSLDQLTSHSPQTIVGNPQELVTFLMKL